MKTRQRQTLWMRGVGMCVLVLLACASLGAWAIASPVGSSPDDDFHMNSIWCALGERPGLCEAAAAPDERRVQSRMGLAHQCYAYHPETSAACELSNDDYHVTNRGNFIGDYPPIYYTAMGVFASKNITVSVMAMRMVNVLLFVGLVTTMLLLLGRAQRGPLIWSLVVGLVPLGMFVLSSVNPSSWGLTAISMLWLALVGYFTAERRGRRIVFGVFALLLAVMGAGARADTAAFVALSAVVAAVLTFRRSRQWWQLAALPAVIVAIGAIFFLAAGQGTHIAGYEGKQQTSVLYTPKDHLRHALAQVMHFPALLEGAFGGRGLGWLDTSVPPLVSGLIVPCYAAVVFWGLRRSGGRKMLVLALTGCAIVALPMYVYVRQHIGVGVGVQARYVLPLMIMFAGIALYGLRRDHLGLRPVQATLVMVGVAAANSVALFYNLRRYLTGLDVASLNLNRNIEWWWQIPVSPMSVWFVGSAAFTLLLCGLLYAMYRGRERRLRLRAGRWKVTPLFERVHNKVAG